MAAPEGAEVTLIKVFDARLAAKPCNKVVIKFYTAVSRWPFVREDPIVRGRCIMHKRVKSTRSSSPRVDQSVRFTETFADTCDLIAQRNVKHLSPCLLREDTRRRLELGKCVHVKHH